MLETNVENIASNVSVVVFLASKDSLLISPKMPILM